MIVYLTLCALALCRSLLCDESACECGTIRGDPLYAKAVYLASEAASFCNKGAYPFSAEHFYPSFEAMQEWECYPFVGFISWKTNSTRSTRAAVLEKFDAEHRVVESPKYNGDSYPTTTLYIPSKLIRTLELNASQSTADDFELSETQEFHFDKNYGTIPQVFRILKNDLHLYYKEQDRFLEQRLNEAKQGADIHSCSMRDDYIYADVRKELREDKKQWRLKREYSLQLVEEREVAALAACTASLDRCLLHHKNPVAHINRGLFYYLEGHVIEALDQFHIAAHLAPNSNLQPLEDTALLIKGQTELEAGLYADAILSLSELIQRNPENKKAYFERAGAYFELGDFDLSITDYLSSGIRPHPIPEASKALASFALGLTQGALQGGMQSGTEFIPSLLSSLHGIGHGLWAFAQDPVQVSLEFVDAARSCIEFIKTHTPQEALQELVPELQDLVQKWNELKEAERGNLTGIIIGRYGVDIFLGGSAIKSIQACRSLKMANNALTLEAMAISERNATLIKLEAKGRAQNRQAILKHSNLKVQWDKQGKHIEGHVNSLTAQKRSILVHSDPQRLVNDFAGKGWKDSHAIPGSAGYVEVVDFKEFIGFDVAMETGEKRATTWGKIHYAKDGIHIVPTKPRG